MDNLFKIRVLTAAVNSMIPPQQRIYDRYFAPKLHGEITDRLAFDIISGSEKILANLSVFAESVVTDKTARKTITLTAPRLATKRIVHAAEVLAVRAFGSQFAVETMRDRIAREQMDMLNEHRRTLEFWAAHAMRGIILDSDLTTELVNYNLPSTHLVTLTGTDLWTNASSKPIKKLRDWKKTIEDDSGSSNITGWHAYIGGNAMDALLEHAAVLDMLKYQGGVQIAETGRIGRLAEVDMEEYNGSFLDKRGARQRFVDPNYILLIGECSDLTDCPFAPIVDEDAPGPVGNVDSQQRMVLYFSKSWSEKDPSARWIKVEGRPLPVVQRPGAIIYAKVV